MTDAIGLDFTRLRSAYRSGETTPSRIVETVFDRIAARGDDGVWLSLLPKETVLAMARRLESLSPGERVQLPLWGLPFGVKDSIDLAGCPTTLACPAFAYQPERSATAVERLIAAGALPIGKTNLDQFATGLVGARVLGTKPRNPFDPAYISGGSSSGSALAVSLGQVSFAVATDTAGSGRVPAGLCSVVGVKPTRGQISMVGLVPACRSADCITLMALTVDDAMEAFAAAAGFDPADPYCRIPPVETRTIAPAFRFGVPSAAFRRSVADAAAERGFAEALDHLAALGGTPVELDFAPFLEAGQLLYGPFVAERFADLGGFAEAHPDALHPVTREILLDGGTITGADVFMGQHRLAEIAASIRPLWDELACLVVPTYPRPVRLAALEADPIALNAMLGTYTTFGNLLDLAGIAVPAGFRPDGLPHGITLLGPAFSDRGLAGLAGRFQRKLGLPLGATGSLPALA